MTASKVPACSFLTIHNNGLAVMGGFIIGFDNDPPDIFQKQVNFIQKNGIVTAMIGFLTAIPLGILEKKSRNYYWKLLGDGIAKHYASFGDVVTMAVYGYHFRKLFCEPD